MTFDPLVPVSTIIGVKLLLIICVRVAVVCGVKSCNALCIICPMYHGPSPLPACVMQLIPLNGVSTLPPQQY